MKLLIIEDDEGLRRQYNWSITGFDLVFAHDRATAIEQIQRGVPELVLLDLGLPPDPDNATEGLSLLSAIMQSCPGTNVIVLTGSSQHQHALDAIRLGAFDFQHKGISADTLQFVLERAAKMQQLAAENRAMKEAQYCHSHNVIGNSTAIKQAIRTLTRCAPMPVSVLLRGESGTGKEVFARMLHELSGRTGEFIAINCASIPKELLESELFGHEKGAFTGASRKKQGKVMLANKGTLFLDEIGDMHADLQAKMLRFLQERTVEPVGSEQSVQVDVRVVCATHRDLLSMTANNEFREDLYFRLTEFQLNIPALRARDGDVVVLASFFLDQYRRLMDLSAERRASDFSREAILAMKQYHWPGNIRELQNKIKGALINAENPLISPLDLQLPSSHADHGLLLPAVHERSEDEVRPLTLTEIRDQADALAVFEAFQRAAGNISQASKELGITRKTFYALIDRHKLRPAGSSISDMDESEDNE
jgi:two-component system NtrC family response regulator